MKLSIVCQATFRLQRISAHVISKIYPKSTICPSFLCKFCIMEMQCVTTKTFSPPIPNIHLNYNRNINNIYFMTLLCKPDYLFNTQSLFEFTISNYIELHYSTYWKIFQLKSNNRINQSTNFQTQYKPLQFIHQTRNIHQAPRTLRHIKSVHQKSDLCTS